MIILSVVTFLSFILLVISLFINSYGGIYTHSYIANDDLYRISELQGSGGNDHIFLILGSFILFLLMVITLFVRPIKEEIKSYSFLAYLMLTLYIFNLMETSNFIEITYSTIFLGKNYIYLIWLLLYILMFLATIYKVIIFLKLSSTREI